MILENIDKIKENGIVKINNFLSKEELKKFSNIITFYSAPKNHPDSYFPINYKGTFLKIFKLKFKNFTHSLEILRLQKKKELNILANNFFKKKSYLHFIDGYYSKVSKSAILPWHTDQAYSGKKTEEMEINNPDNFYLKIFIYLTDVGPNNGCMSYIPKSHKFGYAIRKGIFEQKIPYQPYWRLQDFRKIILDNKKYFKDYFKDEQIINDFIYQTDFIEKGQENEKSNFDYSAKAGSAIIFDEGGVHKGSKPQQSDRMVLRYLYSIKKK
tara:strand:+ start:5344 stop:6150 length:807 start_codon:yes stop_codon:yes gene_type:complete